MEKIDARKHSPETQYEIRKQVIRLRKQGIPNKVLAQGVGISIGRASKIWQSYMKEGSRAIKLGRRGRRMGEKRTLTTEQEAQQITAYISMLLVAPFALMMLVLQNPNSLIVKVLSYIPVLTPSIMVLRVSIQMPSAWEILATVALMIVSIIAMMWVAGKIFRIAILSYGKRPTLHELFQWVREK